MKIFILITLILILHTACMKEDTLHLISTDFEGRFLLQTYNEQYESTIFIADQNGVLGCRFLIPLILLMMNSNGSAMVNLSTTCNFHIVFPVLLEYRE